MKYFDRKDTKGLRTTIVKKIEELMSYQQQWHDLWLRSNVTSPTYLLEHFALYNDFFNKTSHIMGILVTNNENRLLGGIIFVPKKRRFGLSRFALPNNDWVESGTTLVVENENKKLITYILVKALDYAKKSFIEFNGLSSQDSSVATLNSISSQLNFSIDSNIVSQTGTIDTSDNWEDYNSRLSKNFRKNLRRRERRLNEKGALNLVKYDDLSPKEAAYHLLQGFKLEATGWKGDAGTAVLNSPKITDFYLEQAKMLALKDQLRLFFLTLDDELIAFEYGWLTKRCYHSNKTTYFEKYAAHSPGQLLFKYILQYYFQSDRCDAIDVQGPITPAINDWRPEKSSTVNHLLAVNPLSQNLQLFRNRINAMRPQKSPKL